MYRIVIEYDGPKDIETVNFQVDLFNEFEQIYDCFISLYAIPKVWVNGNSSNEFPSLKECKKLFK